MAMLQWGVVIGASLLAVVADVRSRRIPNALTLPLLAIGLIWATWRGGISGLGDAVGACVLLAVPYVLLFVFAGGGAGDAKLMGAIGTWLGVKQSVVVLLCVTSAGMFLALAKAVTQRRLKVVLTNVLISSYTFALCVAGGGKPSLAHCRGEIDTEASDRLDVPYGVAIAMGACLAATVVGLWGTEWLRLW
jgi:Flp pilus assembly protein protease CpaA